MDLTSQKKTLLFVLPLFLISSAIIAIWSYACPCERTPGFLLMGEAQSGKVEDWGFANSVPLCQIQVLAGLRPHSINLNCMSTPEGELFLSCSQCDGKYWSKHVGDPEMGKLRLGGKVYSVLIEREVDSVRLDAAWLARLSKLNTQRGVLSSSDLVEENPRPSDWWSFHVVSGDV
ncbi:hypothetical protein N9D99_05525 [Gammaproteobacteria bacterium]|nr:hypothetical protein [Gammaproteobacteria bacterium]